ncbi:MAG: hypothetical protein ISEC1_P0038 [Thiomicrorhabdus sp.]|nr:MAG: hypothetical protein ISEC1_P0038 [Thiomicrorhabdus sp.]
MQHNKHRHHQQNPHGNNPLFSYSLVTLQFTFIGLLIYMLFIQTPYIFNGTVLTLQILSAFIALWAALHLQQKGHFNIVPDPRPNAVLVETGPYKTIRHPMYLSILLFFGVTITFQPTADSILTLVLLAGILLYKLNYEEQLLVQKVMGYRKYQHQTKKLIPFVY